MRMIRIAVVLLMTVGVILGVVGAGALLTLTENAGVSLFPLILGLAFIAGAIAADSDEPARNRTTPRARLSAWWSQLAALKRCQATGREGWRRTLQCAACQIERIEILNTHGEITERTYSYPETGTSQ